MRAVDLLKGIEIILRTQPEAQVETNHDIIFLGHYKPNDMTPEDVAALGKLGWFEREMSWTHFT